MRQSAGRFIVLEPSKVGSQHLTLLEGYLTALCGEPLEKRGLELVYRADPSSLEAMESALSSHFRHEPISVLNVEHRRWIRKIFQEVALVLQAASRCTSTDILLVTCISSPTLVLLELLSVFIGRRNVVLLLHGEIEAIFDPALRGWRTWGGWAYLWSRLRRRSSRLRLAVIAPFIRDELRERMPALNPANTLFVLPHPIVPTAPALENHGAPHRIVFIGYRTRLKGFPRFERLASLLSKSATLEFVAIGDGIAESFSTGRVSRLESSRAYLSEIAKASVALFPYAAGYNASLSAAALDALAAGVHIIATRRRCFEALRDDFGPESVTVYDDESDVLSVLSDVERLDHLRATRSSRSAAILRSPYGLPAVRACFNEMLETLGVPALRTRGA